MATKKKKKGGSKSCSKVRSYKRSGGKKVKSHARKKK